MKTAISIPDRVFAEAERHAHQTGKSRSQLYGEAIRQYLLLHAPEAVTEAMNKACAELGTKDDTFVRSASNRMLRREKW
ncbi:MAG: hypothetical protein PHU85_04955 [Phycisphaerae bacterium]|nr:hypothetical protein [Phycisphaerae bacterium]